MSAGAGWFFPSTIFWKDVQWFLQNNDTRYPIKAYTPPKTNMEPENEPLEEEIPTKKHHF